MKKNKILKKMLSIFCIVCIVMGGVPIVANAVGETEPLIAEGTFALDDNDGKIRFELSNTSLYYMQTEDNQVFTSTNTMSTRKYSDKATVFKYIIFDKIYNSSCTEEHCINAVTTENYTNDFLARLTSAIAEIPNGTTPASWTFNSNSTGDSMITNGQITEKTFAKNGFLTMGDYALYVSDLTSTFVGNSPSEHGEIETGYYFKAVWTCSGNTYHLHVPVSINITDARELIDKYNKLSNIINNPNTVNIYTPSTITVLENAVEGTPTDMIDGTVYYSQTDVDNALALLTSAENAIERLADYSEYNKVLSEAQAIIAAGNDDEQYEADAFDMFEIMVEATDNSLSKTLGTSDQAIVDKKVQALSKLLTVLAENKYCDYSALDAAIILADACPKTNDGTYTAESFAALQNALTAATSVERSLLVGPNGVNQNTINTLTKNLIDSVNGFSQKADYSAYYEAFNRADDIINVGGTYEINAYKNFREQINSCNSALNKDLADTDDNRTAIADATEIINSEIKTLLENKVCDYKNFNELYTTAKNTPNNGYTDASWNALQRAVVSAEDINMGWVVGENNINQIAIDTTIAALESTMNGLAQRADYTAYTEKIENAYIVENDDETYDAAAYEAYIENLDSIDNSLNKDLPLTAENQALINEKIEAIEAARELLETNKYCNYTALDELIKTASEIEKGNSTDSSWNALQDAINAAKDIDRDLTAGDGTNQEIIDNTLAAINEAINALTDKANYSAYDNAIAEANSLGNSDGRYDADDFDSYKEAIKKIDDELNKDLPNTPENAEKIENAINAIAAEKAKIDEKMNYSISYYDVNGNLIKVDTAKATTVGSLDMPILPTDTDTKKYIGWKYANDVLANSTDTVTSDIELYMVFEYTTIIAKENTTIVLNNDKNYITGIKKTDNSVSDFLATIENDETVVIIRNYEGALLTGEDKIGTGSTITLKSKYTDTIYDIKTVILAGDTDGNGLITKDDYNITVDLALGASTFNEEEQCFFTAADLFTDGVIDVLDVFYVERLSNS